MEPRGGAEGRWVDWEVRRRNLSVIASLEKSHNQLETGGWRVALFMLRCVRIPVMLNLLTAVAGTSS